MNPNTTLLHLGTELPPELLLSVYALTTPRSALALTCQSIRTALNSGPWVSRAWIHHLLCSSTCPIPRPVGHDHANPQRLSRDVRRRKTRPYFVSRFSSFLQYRLAQPDHSSDVESYLLDYLYCSTGPFARVPAAQPADFDMTHSFAAHLANARFMQRSLTFMLPHRAWHLYPDAFHLTLYFLLAGNAPLFQRSLSLLLTRLPWLATDTFPLTTWVFLTALDARPHMRTYYARMNQGADRLDPTTQAKPAWTFLTFLSVVAATQWNLAALDAIAAASKTDSAHVHQWIVQATSAFQQGDRHTDRVTWPLGCEAVTRAMRLASLGGEHVVRFWERMRTKRVAAALAKAAFPVCLYALDCQAGGEWELFKYLFDTYDAPALTRTKRDEVLGATGIGHQARAVGNAIVAFALDKQVPAARAETLPRAFELGMVSVAAKAKVLAHGLMDPDEEPKRELIALVQKSTSKWYGVFIEALDKLMTHPLPNPQALAALLDLISTTKPTSESLNTFNTTQLLVSRSRTWPWPSLLRVIQALPLLAHPLDIPVYLNAVLTWIGDGHEQPGQVAGKRLFAVYLVVHMFTCASEGLVSVESLVQQHLEWPGQVGLVYLSCLEHVVRKHGRVLPDMPGVEAVVMFDEVLDAMAQTIGEAAAMVPRGYADIVVPRLVRQGTEALAKALQANRARAAQADGRTPEELARLTSAVDKARQLHTVLQAFYSMDVAGDPSGDE